ncbi:yippee-like protein [Chlorella sorokiniana]|uniref:Yippee-like protein n=1 Tax=Chlorella sorokiniana TaxID=3076 RepID=A0A2P6TTF0_CHLSO|nr:yippee-like protein [Chlorella sorokiniana]|eukprot:PRW57347.1 yippee-like protein [Chlorella sorokiniana]
MASAVAAPVERPLPLLELPPNALLGVFAELKELADAVALSSCCRELWALGGAARRRHLCCAACGHALCEAAQVLSSEAHREAPALRLPDGTSVAADPQHCTGCRLSEEQPLEALEVLLFLRVEMGLRRVGNDSYEVRAQQVLCGGCGVHLGLRLVQLGSLRAGAVPPCIRHWRELQVLGTAFLARPYLRLRKPDGHEEHLGRPPPPAALAVYTCTAARSTLAKPGGCGAPLFVQRALLSKQHVWDAGDGPERAWFINTFLPGAVVERNEREEELCQGPMRVSDVYCARCAARIGWRFCRDLLETQPNANQVGRYGVVTSSIQKEGPSGSSASPPSSESPLSSQEAAASLSDSG